MKVIIIGGGASGLTAAITAARIGATVTIIEHENKPGKKILITGNGKCNITNTALSKDKYYGDTEFVNSIIDSFGFNDTIRFFENMGVTVKNKNGYIYPASEQASTIINTLRDTAISLGVSIKANNKVKSILRKDNGFLVDIGIELYCDKLIIATGGMSFDKTGSKGDGYKWAKDFGHHIITPQPALTAIVCDRDCLFKASGVRVYGRVSINSNNISCLGYDCGELQITDYGVSGIPVFNVSHLAEPGRTVVIDFLPDTDFSKCLIVLSDMFKKREFMNALSALNGLFNEKLSAILLEKANIDKTLSAKDITKEQLNTLTGIIKKYELTVKSLKGFDFAQITKGGIDTSEINANTMESKLIKNLYFTGEILDVDGICGGYNLQFAWATGTIAGRNC